jgi:DtxR family transcriptional regulator, Mn-dependent transcriptional regulator
MSESVEEYLEALFVLSNGGRPVSTSELSRRLKINPASVTEMLKKLSLNGYVAYSPYQGASLTEAGQRYGRKMVRKHRLLEKFLHDVLHIGNDKVHDYACEMEHSLSDDVERNMCQTLKQPDQCPDDGQSIPPCDFNFNSCQECEKYRVTSLDNKERRQADLVSVKALSENQTGKVAFIRGGQQVVKRLVELGLTPGTELKVIRSAPFRGPLQIDVRGTQFAIGQQIADKIFVEIKPSGPPSDSSA